MIDGVSSLMSIFSVLSQSGMWNLEERENNLFDGGSHFYNTYETSDNKFISIGSLEPKFYNLLKDKLGITDPQFNNQMSKDNWPELKIKTAAIFKTKTQQQWNKILENTDICYAPVLSLNEAKKHPHLIERGNFIELDGITQPSPAPRFSLTKSDKPKPAPEKGQDNNEILMNIGYSSNEIEDLIKNNTIK